jgi:hypothetical protein
MTASMTAAHATVTGHTTKTKNMAHKLYMNQVHTQEWGGGCKSRRLGVVI